MEGKPNLNKERKELEKEIRKWKKEIGLALFWDKLGEKREKE